MVCFYYDNEDKTIETVELGEPILNMLASEYESSQWIAACK